jgi:hypothetical protein
MTTDTINFPRSRPPLIFLDEIFLGEMTESGDRGIRALLPISSGISVPPNRKSRIPVSHPAAAFQPERLALGGDAQNWIVNDILIGERSQISVLSSIAGDAGIPGEVFASRATDCLIKFETAQTSMLITLIVTYVGDDPLGAPFACVLLGTAAT